MEGTVAESSVYAVMIWLRSTDAAAQSDDPQFGLRAGDVLICGPMHRAWQPEKVAVLSRESDGYEPGCAQYREHVRHLSGPRS